MDFKELKVQKNKQYINVADTSEENGIAIIGMASRFPNSENPDEFWTHLVEQRDLIQAISESRKRDLDDYLHYTKDENNEYRYAEMGYLADVDMFDYPFFRLSPAEAQIMDPNQRLFLQTVWHAIEDAGYGNQRLAGSDTGVYVGYNEQRLGNYSQLIFDIAPEQLTASTPGNLSPMIASRIAFLLDLQGPNLVVNTACSSSLVAIHLACQALRAKECGVAIAGGINLRLFPLYQEDGLGTSADGRTRAFDDDSSGTGIGEGSAAIVLKPLKQAILDQDNIYAVIKGSAVNQDGNSIGITAPNAAAQAKVIQKAWENAKIDPETISYIEAHGTATKLGDPVELDGIQRAFGKYTQKKQFCGIGSVKTNIGHTDCVAGLAGLIKAVLALRHKYLPASLHFAKPNHEIQFHKSPVFVTDRGMPWDWVDGLRRCGVSSFGLSGTNCHIVLEEYVEPTIQTEEQGLHLLAVSSRTEHGLLKLLQEMRAYVQKSTDCNLNQLCQTMNEGRDHHAHRMALVVHDREDLLQKLNMIQAEGLALKEEAGIYYGFHKIIPDLHHSRKAANEATRADIQLMTERALSIIREFPLSEEPPIEGLLSLCRLYITGAQIDWKRIHEGRRVVKLGGLPPYSFERLRCWPVTPRRWQGAQSFFQSKWERVEAPVLLEQAEPIRVLLLHDGENRGHTIAKRLLEKNHQVVEVHLGELFEKRSGTEFIIGQEQEDYETLLEQLGEEEFTHIVLCSLNEEMNTLQRLFYLIKALASEQRSRSIQLMVLVHHAFEVSGEEAALLAHNAALIALSKVAVQEHPQFNVRCIDTDDRTHPDTIISDICYGSTFLTAYRRDIAYQEIIDYMPVAQIKSKPTPIRRDGVYVITGGRGGMGLEICKYLSAQNPIKLALISRSPVPPRNDWDRAWKEADQKLCTLIEAVREIEANGTEVQIYQADVTDFNQMERVFKDIRSRYQTINGVIHSAGLAGEKLLFNKSREQFDRVLAVKMKGVRNLDALTQSDELDFFVVFSAVSALFGIPGQGDYAAANAYLDAYAAVRSRRGKRTISINWPAWKETGMAVDYAIDIDHSVFKALTNNEAIHCFDYVLNSDVQRVIIGEMNMDIPLDQGELVTVCLSEEIRNNWGKNTPSREVNHASPAVSEQSRKVHLRGREDGNYTELERALAQIWGEVFGLSEIDVYSSFYEMGGDSIFGIKLVNRAVQRGIQLRILDIMSHLTIAELALHLEVGHEIRKEPITPLKVINEEKDLYHTTFAQKRLYFLQQLDPSNVAYHVTASVRISGGLQLNRLQMAFQKLVQRHEALRTALIVVDGEVMQRIEKEVFVELEVHRVDEQDVHQQLEDWFTAFELDKAPLIRMGVFEHSEEDHILVVAMHHLISDDVSVRVMLQDLFHYYDTDGGELPKLSAQFKDYSEWLHQCLSSKQLVEQENYWMELFSNPPLTKLLLPTDYPEPEQPGFSGSRLSFELEENVTQRVRWFNHKTGTTPFMLLLTVYHILLHKYTNQEDIVIGTPVSGRPHEELEHTVGMYVNTLALRNRVSSEQSFEELLQVIKQNSLAAYANQDYPMEQISQKLKLERDSANSAFYRVLYIHYTSNNLDMGSAGLKLSAYELPGKSAKFDLSLETMEQDGKMRCQWEYRSALFKESTIEQFAADFKSLLRKVLAQPKLPIKEIQLKEIELYESKVDENDFAFDFD